MGLNRYSRLVEHNWRVKTRCTCEGKCAMLLFLWLGYFTQYNFSHFHPFISKFRNLVLLYNWIRLCCIFVSHFHHPFISRWTAKLILWQGSNKHGVSVAGSRVLWIYAQLDIWCGMASSIILFLQDCIGYQRSLKFHIIFKD